MTHETVDNLRKERDRLRKENLDMKEAIRMLLLHASPRPYIDGSQIFKNEITALAAFLNGMPAKIGKEKE